jgi:hypothetical protein
MGDFGIAPDLRRAISWVITISSVAGKLSPRAVKAYFGAIDHSAFDDKSRKLNSQSYRIQKLSALIL